MMQDGPIHNFWICRIVGQTPAFGKTTALCLQFTTCAITLCFRFELQFELRSEAIDKTLTKILQDTPVSFLFKKEINLFV